MDCPSVMQHCWTSQQWHPASLTWPDGLATCRTGQWPELRGAAAAGLSYNGIFAAAGCDSWLRRQTLPRAGASPYIQLQDQRDSWKFFHGAGPRRVGQGVRLACAVLAAAVLAVPLAGCGGAAKTSEEARKELERLKKEKPKPPFDQMRVFAEPNERSHTPPKVLDKDGKEKEPEGQIIVRNAIKPGHWTGVLVEAKANLFDFSGELVSEPRDNQQRLLDLEGSPFSLVTARPAVLPKGQKKSLEAMFFSPPSSRTVLEAEQTNRGRDLLAHRHRSHEQLDLQPTAQPAAGHRVAGVARAAAAHAQFSVLPGGARARSEPLSVPEGAHLRQPAGRAGRGAGRLDVLPGIVSSAGGAAGVAFAIAVLDEHLDDRLGRPAAQPAHAGPAAGDDRMAELGRQPGRQRTAVARRAAGDVFGRVPAGHG